MLRSPFRNRDVSSRSGDSCGDGGGDEPAAFPRREIRGYEDLSRFGSFEDEWLRGGPVRVDLFDVAGHGFHDGVPLVVGCL